MPDEDTIAEGGRVRPRRDDGSTTSLPLRLNFFDDGRLREGRDRPRPRTTGAGQPRRVVPTKPLRNEAQGGWFSRRFRTGPAESIIKPKADRFKLTRAPVAYRRVLEVPAMAQLPGESRRADVTGKILKPQRRLLIAQIFEQPQPVGPATRQAMHFFCAQPRGDELPRPSRLVASVHRQRLP